MFWLDIIILFVVRYEVMFLDLYEIGLFFSVESSWVWVGKKCVFIYFKDKFIVGFMESYYGLKLFCNIFNLDK